MKYLELYKTINKLAYNFYENEEDIYLKISASKILKRLAKNRPIKVIIPTAGKASRLKGVRAKSLIEINGKTTLHRILEIVTCFDQNPIIVVNPKNKSLISSYVENLGYNAKFIIQQEQHGMGHAILKVYEELHQFSGDILIIWGDMPMVKYSTISKTVFFHRLFSKEVSAIIPTTIKTKPYIAIIRDKDLGFIDVLQQREGNIMPDVGENDCGIFVVKSRDLWKSLNQLWKECKSKTTIKELNFLPVFSHMYSRGKRIMCIPVARNEESISINTQNDIKLIKNLYIKDLWN